MSEVEWVKMFAPSIEAKLHLKSGKIRVTSNIQGHNNDSLLNT